MKECAWQLFGDLGYALFPALITIEIVLTILIPPPVSTIIAITFALSNIGYLALASYSEGSNAAKMGNYHRIFWYRTQAMRTCGYEKVAKLERKGLFPKKCELIKKDKKFHLVEIKKYYQSNLLLF